MGNCWECKYCRIPERIPKRLLYEDGDIIYCLFLDEYVVVMENCPYCKR